MQKVTWRLIAVVALWAAWSAVSARADDAIPPCWRGQPGTTFQLWNFNADNNPAAPEQANNPNGSPQASVQLGVGAAGWVDTLSLFDTNQGIWDLGKNGTMTLAIPNSPAPAGSWKYVWVQVTEYRDSIYNASAAVAVPGATRLSGQVRTNHTTLFGAWITDQSLWLIEPCPASESVIITAGNNSSAIDQVVIDTRCSTADTGDIAPPCWRGQAGTTLQDWSFHNTANPATPEQFSSPGSPQASIQVGALGAGWTDQLAGFGCRQGFWDLGTNGTITLTVPNSAGSAASYKYIRMQVVQFQDPFTYNQLVSISLAPGATLVSRHQQAIDSGVFGQWVVDESVWRVAPSPASESIVINSGSSGSLIDQIVVDTLSLDFACPSDVAAIADPGSCSKANVTWTTPAVDGCKVTAVSCVPANGSTFNVGHNPVTCTITDGQGGTAQCHFNVNVADTELPVVHCPADMMVTNNPALCGTNITFAPTATDNCPGSTASCIPPSGSLFPLGLTTVNCTAHDAAANASTPCSFTILVVDYSGDIAAPCWRGQPASTYQHWAFSTPANPANPELKNCPGNPKAAIQLGTLGTGWNDYLNGFGCKHGFWDLGGSGTITLSVSNVAGSATSYKYVRIQVTQFSDPLAYNQLTTVSMTPGATLVSRQQTPLEPAAFGQWIVDESIWRISPCPDFESIVLTAGTSGALVDQVVVDTLCVDLTCPSDILASADSGQCHKANVTWTTPTIDGCVVTAVSCTPSSGSTFQVGNTPVSCTVTDGESQHVNCNFNVSITDNENPVAHCQNITVALDGTGHAAITAAQIDNGSTDNCGIASMSVTPNTFTCASVGPNPITLTVTDVHGNSAQCGATVTVTDAPVLVCPPNITVFCAGNSGTQVSFAPTATDPCDAHPTISCFPASGSTFPEGTNTVTCIATNAAGSPSLGCSFKVIVNDPTVTSLAIVHAPPNVILSWPQSCTIYTLEKSSILPNWAPSGLTVVSVGGTYYATNSDTGTFFYRLKH